MNLDARWFLYTFPNTAATATPSKKTYKDAYIYIIYIYIQIFPAIHDSWCLGRNDFTRTFQACPFALDEDLIDVAMEQTGGR